MEAGNCSEGDGVYYGFCGGRGELERGMNRNRSKLSGK